MYSLMLLMHILCFHFSFRWKGTSQSLEINLIHTAIVWTSLFRRLKAYHLNCLKSQQVSTCMPKPQPIQLFLTTADYQYWKVLLFLIYCQALTKEQQGIEDLACNIQRMSYQMKNSGITSQMKMKLRRKRAATKSKLQLAVEKYVADNPEYKLDDFNQSDTTLLFPWSRDTQGKPASNYH